MFRNIIVVVSCISRHWLRIAPPDPRPSNDAYRNTPRTRSSGCAQQRTLPPLADEMSSRGWLHGGMVKCRALPTLNAVQALDRVPVSTESSESHDVQQMPYSRPVHKKMLCSYSAGSPSTVRSELGISVFGAFCNTTTVVAAASVLVRSRTMDRAWARSSLLGSGGNAQYR
jgi:hypothetical protein